MEKLAILLTGTYGRGLLMAIGLWSVHFWLIAAAFVWLPMELSVLALPVIVGSAVILVWRLERKVLRTLDVQITPASAWAMAERCEPLLPQPEQGWTWQHVTRDAEHSRLAEPSLRRDAA